MKGKRWGSK